MKSIKSKLFLLSFLSIVLTSIVAIICMFIGNEIIFDGTLKHTIESSMNTLVDRTEDMKKLSARMAFILAGDDQVRQAILTGDKENVLNVVNGLFQKYDIGVEYATISDSEGNVIARTYSSKSGDSVANQKNVRSALNDSPASYIESGTEIQLAIRSAAPVKNELGEIVGIISAGYRLDTDTFVDSLKNVTGTDFTMFKQDTRVASTIMSGGTRDLGTQLDENIAQMILEQKQSYYARENILGKPYYAYYHPVISDGEVLGIFLSGQPLESLIADKTLTVLIAIGATIALSIIMLLIVMRISSKQIVAPILNMSEASLQLSRGNLDVEGFLYQSHDELGRLSNSIYEMSISFKNLINDLNDMSEEHHLGNIDIFMEKGKYVGSYRDVAASVNRMVSEHIDIISRAISCISEMIDGHFGANMEPLPGKKAVINKAIDNLRESLRGINGEIDFMIKNAADGNLTARIDVAKYEGDWIALLNGLNQLMEAISSPIHEVSAVLKQVSLGNFDTKVSGDYKGDFLIMKGSINETVTNIAQYIHEISGILSAMSDNNDLTREITREYAGSFSHIKDALNGIIGKLNMMIAEIYKASDQVAQGAKQISESSMMLAQGASEQAGSVEALNATIASFNESAVQNAENAKKAENLADTSKNGALKGNEEMQSLLVSMDEINASSDNIAKIIKVIDDIAFQTNLLALNAAVESARAGEYGKGFSVVAEEVRNLAHKSSEASKEISALIEESIVKVDGGIRASGATAETLNLIVGGVTQVAGLITGIAHSSDKQAETISNVTTGLAQINAVVQSNSAASEEAASSSQQLSSQAEVLRNLVSIFKLKE